MADWVIPLADEAAQDAEVAGSKGATLAKMIGARFRVPEGFAVATGAFEQVVRVRVKPGRFLRGLDPSNHRQLQTRDPLSGKNRFVVNAALGLGEGVVAGGAETDRFVLGPRNLKVISSAIADKQSRAVTQSKGGINTVAVSAKASKRPVLTAAQLRTLARTGKKLSDLLGGPQDIEFALQDRRIHILRARPMTALELEAVPEARRGTRGWIGGEPAPVRRDRAGALRSHPRRKVCRSVPQYRDLERLDPDGTAQAQALLGQTDPAADSLRFGRAQREPEHPAAGSPAPPECERRIGERGT